MTVAFDRYPEQAALQRIRRARNLTYRQFGPVVGVDWHKLYRFMTVHNPRPMPQLIDQIHEFLAAEEKRVARRQPRRTLPRRQAVPTVQP
jgi:hypothetical protein